MNTPTTVELAATFCFIAAIVHTFSVKLLQGAAKKYPAGSVGENIFHLLGEVEVVFGVWAAAFTAFLAINQGSQASIDYLETLNFTEPGFVFVIMAICSTQPLLSLATRLIDLSSKIVGGGPIAFYFSTLTLGPLLGSLITEPAAMTVTALILLEVFYSQAISLKLKYATLGLLFVNISIGGTLTPFAAPPVLMVAKVWDWDLAHMLTHFGWKAALAVIVGTAAVTFRFKDELKGVSVNAAARASRTPAWVTGLHLLFLVLIILSAHHLVLCIGLFLFFLGLYAVTQEYQTHVRLREGLLVAFFLGGLVVLGAPQRWWLEPLLAKLDVLPLFLGAISLTAITDNAAITYLGTQVPTLSEAARYALVAGAVTGGGLTVIANAPNPAGYSILNSSFGHDGISPLLLFTHAVGPTILAALCFWCF